MTPYRVFLFLIAALILPMNGAVSEGRMVPEKIGIEERLGQTIPLDATFHDEKETAVTLRDLIDKPTVVSLVYLSCTHICPTLLGGLAEAVGALRLTPGKDYALITVSFDDRDTPKSAGEKKRNYLQAIGKPLPENSWRFLTGDANNIRGLTEAVGFHFRREDAGFSHPRVLIFLSSGGKIVRYLYGTTFAPLDIKLALAEASREERALNEGKLLLFSYGYDPRERKYTFNLLKVSGTVLLFSIASLSVFIMLTRKKIMKGEIFKITPPPSSPPLKIRGGKGEL